MKIRHIVGDLLSVTSGMIVHGCNEKGKMNNCKRIFWSKT